MDEHEKLLYIQSLERMVSDREKSMNEAKEELKKRKDAFDTAVNELRLAIRRDDDQIDIPFTDHQVIGEDRQIPENKTADVPDGVLFENPIDGEPVPEYEPTNVLTLPERQDSEDHDNGR